MPRNDQLTRQWHLLRHLEAAAHGATLQVLADALPADFPKHLRTVRRDLEGLEAAGFPRLIAFRDREYIPRSPFTQSTN